MVRPIGKCTVDNQTRCDAAQIVEFGSLWSEAGSCVSSFHPIESYLHLPENCHPCSHHLRNQIWFFYDALFSYYHGFNNKRLLGAEPEGLWRYTKDWRTAFVLKVGCGHVSMKVMSHDAHERRGGGPPSSVVSTPLKRTCRRKIVWKNSKKKEREALEKEEELNFLQCDARSSMIGT